MKVGGAQGVQGGVKVGRGHGRGGGVVVANMPSSFGSSGNGCLKMSVGFWDFWRFWETLLLQQIAP